MIRGSKPNRALTRPFPPFVLLLAVFLACFLSPSSRCWRSHDGHHSPYNFTLHFSFGRFRLQWPRDGFGHLREDWQDTYMLRSIIIFAPSWDSILGLED